MKILLLDIETAPNVAHVWGLWNQNVGTNQIIDSGYVMCWSAKWYGSDEVVFSKVNTKNPRRSLTIIHRLLNEADAVVHYNGTKFDIPTLNKEFVIHGFTPPSPYKQIDLLKVARNRFRFASNKLDYVARSLKLGGKLDNTGHSLWIRCMAGEAEAWKEMEKYNRHDIKLLEMVYEKLKPWIKNHSNWSIHSEEKCCPNCGSNNFKRRGFSFTATQKYQRYICSSCGNWFRSGKSLAKGPETKGVNI